MAADSMTANTGFLMLRSERVMSPNLSTAGFHLGELVVGEADRRAVLQGLGPPAHEPLAGGDAFEHLDGPLAAEAQFQLARPGHPLLLAVLALVRLGHEGDEAALG